MNIHEYQAKQLLAKYGVAVPKGGVAYTADEAVKVAEDLGGPVWVVKSQIHAGGRGAGRFKDDDSDKGGVRVVKSVDEVRENVAGMLHKILVTKQTGEEGKEVKRVYIEEGCDIARELYLGILIDRATSRVTIMASTEGGMEIEEVAEATPEKILRIDIDPATGIQPFHTRQIAFGLGLEGDQIKAASRFLLAMYEAFTELDASIVEINPLVVTGSGDVIALDAKMNFDDNALFRHKDVAELRLDAKMNFDDNALFRHKDVAELRDEDEEDPTELEAAKHDLNYITLDGSIGCMVNGAGLAMATMDIIKLYGGSPANFLDVGGGATKERVTTAFKLILSDPNVESILVNIFGGIMRCDVIAEGVVAAAREVSLDVPLVVRLAGTNVELGKKILEDSGLPIVSADNLADAAEKVVKVTQEAA